MEDVPVHHIMVTRKRNKIVNVIVMSEDEVEKDILKRRRPIPTIR